MAQSFAEMIDRLKKGDLPSTEEFARDLDELQQQMRGRVHETESGIKIRHVSDAEARVILVGILKHLEQGELPKLIATVELLRRQLNMPSMLFKRMGDFL